jgi:hypothetical protein
MVANGNAIISVGFCSGPTRLRLFGTIVVGFNRAKATKLDEFRLKQVSRGSHLDNYKSEIGAFINTKVKLGQEDFYRQLEEFKAAFINSSRGLSGRLDNVELHVLSLSKSLGSGNYEPHINNTSHPTADRFSRKEGRHCCNQDTTIGGVKDDD